MPEITNDPTFWKAVLSVLGSAFAGAITAVSGIFYWKGKQDVRLTRVESDVEVNKKAISLLMPITQCQSQKKACNDFVLSELGHGSKNMDRLEKLIETKASDESVKMLAGAVLSMQAQWKSQHEDIMDVVKEALKNNVRG